MWVFLAGCWVISEGERERHDRSLEPLTTPSPTDTEPRPTPATDDDRDPDLVDPIACAAAYFPNRAVELALPAGVVPTGLAAVDVDGSGSADLVWTTSDRVYVALQGDPGSFEAAVASEPFGSDLGLPIVAITGESVPDGGGRPVALAVSDGGVVRVVAWNPDAVPQVVATAELPTKAGAVASGAVGDDDSPAIATGNPDTGELTIWRLDDGDWVPRAAGTLGSGAVALAIGDLDGDGLRDLVGATDSEVRIELATLDGPFAAGPVHARPSAEALFVRDLDRDGVNDLVIDGGGIDVLLADGSAPRTTDNPDARVVDVVAFEPGIDDCLSAVASSGGSDPELRLLQGRADGTFGQQSTAALSATSPGVAVARLDGDGLLDVAAIDGDAILVFGTTRRMSP